MYMESVKMRPARLQGTPSARYRENLLCAFPAPLPEAQPRSFTDGPSALYDTPRKSSQRPETHHTHQLTPTSSSTNTTTRLHRVLHAIHPHPEGRTDAQHPAFLITSYSTPRDTNPSAPTPCPAPSRPTSSSFSLPWQISHSPRTVQSTAHSRQHADGQKEPDDLPHACSHQPARRPAREAHQRPRLHRPGQQDPRGIHAQGREGNAQGRQQRDDPRGRGQLASNVQRGPTYQRVS